MKCESPCKSVLKRQRRGGVKETHENVLNGITDAGAILILHSALRSENLVVCGELLLRSQTFPASSFELRALSRVSQALECSRARHKRVVGVDRELRKLDKCP